MTNEEANSPDDARREDASRQPGQGGGLRVSPKRRSGVPRPGDLLPPGFVLTDHGRTSGPEVKK